jgi:hypothetical protein
MFIPDTCNNDIILFWIKLRPYSQDEEEEEEELNTKSFISVKKKCLQNCKWTTRQIIKLQNTDMAHNKN